MKLNIRITAGAVQLDARLNDSMTAQTIWDTLPITAAANTWGDEINFVIPVESELEQGQETVELGDLGYWPPGRAFCIFFGRTPASQGDEIRAASAVTVIGRVLGDASLFRQVTSGNVVKIETIQS